MPANFTLPKKLDIELSHGSRIRLFDPDAGGNVDLTADPICFKERYREVSAGLNQRLRLYSKMQDAIGGLLFIINQLSSRHRMPLSTTERKILNNATGLFKVSRGHPAASYSSLLFDGNFNVQLDRTEGEALANVCDSAQF